jgi:hypothetical protein
VKFSFEVGDREKHMVDFSWNQFWGALKIRVDGRLVKSKAITLSSPTNLFGELEAPPEEKWNVGGLEIQLVERWSFEVGEQEKHQVSIEKERAKLIAWAKPQKYQVYVDNRLVEEHEGY